MCAMSRDPRAIRIPRFEPFEPRVMLSADTAGDFVADFVIDYSIDDYSLDANGQTLETSLIDAHNLTGLTAARNAYGLDGSGQTVVVIDTGVAYDHLALGGGLGADYRVVGGFDFTGEYDADPYDDGPYGSHGTHVAGIIASSDSTNPGVAPGVDVVALRVFDDQGQGQFDWVEDALRWVHDNIDSFENPITTINLSLGVVYNSDGVPSWATLEDELAQLEADGIFISVAAGNNFTRYNETGLSYPAVSEYVVPVASLDGDGSLSFYSQRDVGVIAAPGRSITSTVPDYVGNDNGIDDDFATYSGTSMAAPYVAGASVLIRQAFEFVGVENVTQDTIYELMCSTADTVYDPITGENYFALNLSQALDSIMPDDDFGSTQTAAHTLGSITDTLSLDGTIGRLDDVDWFSFTASQSGVISFSADTTDYLDADWSVDDSVSGVSISDGILSFEVTAGASYSIGLSTADGIGHYSLDAYLEAIGGGNAVEEPGDTPGEETGGENGSNTDGNLGAVDLIAIADQQISAAGRWFSFTAANDGILTVAASFSHTDGDIDIELYDADNNFLRGSYGTGDSERIDLTVSAGDRFYLRAVNVDPGINEAVDFEFVNLVAQNGNTIVVEGTAGDDAVGFSAGDVYQVSVGGIDYSFNASQIEHVTLNGSAGHDTLTITGGAGADNATLGIGAATVEGDGYTITANNFEDVTVSGGGGGGMAVLYDSAGDDSLVITPEYGVLSGSGFTSRVEGFESVLASGSAGGHDTARFFDSAGDDTFLATPTYSRLRGDGFYLRAKGFEAVVVEAVAGGNDSAYLFDSAGNDSLQVSLDTVVLAGDGFSVQVDAFEYVNARATGGFDTATVQTAGGQYDLNGNYALLSGDVSSIRADSFDRVHAQTAATATVSQDACSAASPQSEPLDHVLAQASTSELYGFEYARRLARRYADSTTDDNETQVLDHVLEQLDDWS